MTYILPNPIPMQPTTGIQQPWQAPNQIFPNPVVQQKTSNIHQIVEAFKPKKAGKKTSHVIFVLDDSASMQSCRETTISGYNEYLLMQKKDADENGIPTFVSLYKFNGSSVTCVMNRVSVNEVEDLNHETYNPRGSTNLYDAIGGVMMQVNKDLSEKKKSERDSIIITILTDGQENASKTFNNQGIKQMIEKAEGKNWGFMFLGANIDAFIVGSALGFSTHNTLQFETGAAENTIRAASAMTTRMKSAYASGQDTTLAYATSAFTDYERTQAVLKDEQDTI